MFGKHVKDPERPPTHDEAIANPDLLGPLEIPRGRNFASRPGYYVMPADQFTDEERAATQASLRATFGAENQPVVLAHEYEVPAGAPFAIHGEEIEFDYNEVAEYARKDVAFTMNLFPTRPSLYISGTISSDPNLSFEEAKARFDAARDYLTALGYNAISPTDMEGECGQTPEQCVGTQKKAMPGQGQGNHSWECYLKGDIRAMLLCDGVAVLPNWERSSGAWLEVATAKGVGMEVKPFDQWPLVQAKKPEGWKEDGLTDFVSDAVIKTCTLCGHSVRWLREDWYDASPGPSGWSRYCTVSKDPDALHTVALDD